jgi:hypothetical protein
LVVSKLDSFFYRGGRAAREVSAYSAITPIASGGKAALQSVGSAVFVGAAAAREGLGSQVAHRLALDYFLKGVIEASDDLASLRAAEEDGDVAVGLLHHAFRIANTSVYSFGHKLAAGGRLCASLLGVVVSEGRIAAGRTGIGSVYLFRKGTLLPFFESLGDGEAIGDASEVPDPALMRRLSYIGANSVVDVEVASVEGQPGDIVCAFSRPLTQLNETLLVEALEAFEFDKLFDPKGPQSQRRMDVASLLCKEIFTEPDTLSYAALVRLGPAAIFCSRLVSEAG